MSLIKNKEKNLTNLSFMFTNKRVVLPVVCNIYKWSIAAKISTKGVNTCNNSINLKNLSAGWLPPHTNKINQEPLFFITLHKLIIMFDAQ